MKKEPQIFTSLQRQDAPVPADILSDLESEGTMPNIMENWRSFTEGETIAIGQCYPFALEMARASAKDEFADLSKFKVVHGRVTDKFSGESVLHAWVEKGGMAFDAQTSSTKPDGVPQADYYDMFQPEAHEEYTAEETIINCIKKGHKGPWTDKE